jgi:hypothetical protein
VTTSAWILLITTWSIVGGFSVYLVARVLRTPPRDED